MEFAGLSVDKEVIKYIFYISHLRLIDAGINTYEEGVVHDEIRVLQVPGYAMGNILVGWVTQEIAAEEVSGLDAVGFQKCGQVVTRETGAFPDGDHVTEPGGFGILRSPWQDETVFIGFQDLSEFLKILFAPGDELIEFLELGATNGGLHIRHLEVVADVTVNVFVIVAVR